MNRQPRTEAAAASTPLTSGRARNRGAGSTGVLDQDKSEREAIRLRYCALKNLISDERVQIGSPDSDKFQSVFHQVEKLHQLVRRPREQAADAEALLILTKSLATSVKEQCNGGITATDFVTCLLRDFDQHGAPSGARKGSRNSVGWKNIGVAVSPILRSCRGCQTMIGPIHKEFKRRKPAVRRKDAKPDKFAVPRNVVDSAPKDETETDKIMATMFNILKENRGVGLERLVLNRSSFAQTLENLFALSFLVKDGRVEIKVDENGWQLVDPKNAPAACLVASGDAVYRHFVFRFDFKDWKVMSNLVKDGEELMPNRRNQEDMEIPTQLKKEAQDVNGEVF